MIGFIVAGLVIGALARLIKPGRQNLGVIATLLLGLAGSVIGGIIANLLGTGGIFELNVLGFIVSVIAAVLLIGVAEGLAGLEERGAVQRPGGPADGGDEGPPGQLQQLAAGGLLGRPDPGHDRGEPAVHVHAVVGVADGRVQLGQEVALGGQPGGDLGEPETHAGRVHDPGCLPSGSG